MNANFATLFSPVQVGPCLIKNRSVVTAHSTNFGFYDLRDTGDRLVSYIRRRAAGGVGLIIHDPLVIVPTASPIGLYDFDYMRERFTRLACAVHEHGATLVQQIAGAGALRRSDGTEGTPLWSFSGTTTSDGETAHRMSSQEIEQTINGFVQSARLIVESGIDGIELHATHGSLLQQSFSPWANRRDDEWGEPLRYLRAVIGGVRNIIRSKAILGLRMCVADFVPLSDGGLTSEQLVDIARTLVTEGGVDYINHSEGSQASHYARSVGSWRHPHGEFLGLTAQLKAAVGSATAVIGVGRIVTPEHAEQVLQQGICDLVAMTRAHIADPDLMLKVLSGDHGRIRPCVGANQGCIDRTLVGLPISCLHNPEVGREHSLGNLVHTLSPRHVLVVGGGPAGLKAAEIAARRGHRITLVEHDAVLGGRLRTAAKLASASELEGSIRWLEKELALLQVEVIRNALVDVAFVVATAPDVVVLATGATPRPDQAFGANSDRSIPLMSPDEAMDAELSDRDVLVLDRLGDLEVAFAAEQLALRGARVTIVAPRPSVGTYFGATHLAETPILLAKLGVKIQPNWDAVRIERNRVYLRSTLDGEERCLPFHRIVASVPPTARLDLQSPLEAAGFTVFVVGDANAPRSAMQAFREGDAIGRLI